MGPGNPFPDNVNESSIKRPTLVEHLTPEHDGVPFQAGKQGCEAWCTAWCPHASVFAWSCGHGQVKLMPYHSDGALNNTDGALLGSYFNQQAAVTIDTGDRVWSMALGSAHHHPPSLFCPDSDIGTKTGNLNWYRYKEGKELLLAVGLNNGRIKVYDAHTGKLYLELLDHRDVVRDLKFAPNASQTLVSASRDGTLKVWEMQDDGNMTKTLKSHSKWLYACAWAPNAKMLASVGDNRSVIVWDMVNYKLLHKLEGHHHDVCSCDFSPDGALLATSSCDTRVIIWDPHSGQIFRELQHMYPPPSRIFAGGANDAFVRGVSWSRDGSHLATISDDSYLRFWDLSSSELPCQVVVINNALCCQYSPDGATLAVGTRNGSVSLWLAPMKVQSLQYSCRMAIRRAFPFKHISDLLLPDRLKRYVKYVHEM